MRRTAWNGVCLAALAAFASGAAWGASLENASLRVDVSMANGAFTVLEKASGRCWKPLPEGDWRVADAPRGTATNVSFTLRSARFAEPLAVSLRLEGAELAVTLDAPAATPLSAPLCYPAPFAGVPGERTLLTQGNGMAFPVEMKDLGTDAIDHSSYCGRDMEMGCWGHYAETLSASGEWLPRAGYLAIIETPENAGIDYTVRTNGFRQASVRWNADWEAFGYARRIRYVFGSPFGPVEMAARYRAEMARKGCLVTLAEKKARFPKLAKKVDLLAGAPDVWYWALDGNKPALVRRLKELGLDNLLFCYATRKDLGAWVTREDVDAISRLPGVLQCEYDIYKDTMETTNLARIAYVRPYWSSAAADNDDIVRDRFGNPVRGWRVALKGAADGQGPGLGCATICEARAPVYARNRIGNQLKTWPYDARMLDVTGGSLGDCRNPKHPLHRRQSVRARQKLFDVVQGELGLLAGTEDGGEWCVPNCVYFEGTMSAPNHYRADGGRYMWKVYDAVPPNVARGLDETVRVPFWEMVFHDCVVTYWYWCDYNNKFPSVWWKRDLFNAVCGTPPMYLFTPETFTNIETRLAESVKVATPVAKRTAFSAMTGYRWLSRDRRVQQARFANGVVSTVNFGDVPVTLSDGTEVPPHAARWTEPDANRPILSVRAREIAAFLPRHPSIPGAAAGDRAAWAKLAKTPEAKALLVRADKARVASIPPLTEDGYLEFNRYGIRANYQKPYGERADMLSDLTLAECLTRKGRYLGKIDALLQAICAERSWAYPAHDADLAIFNGTHLAVDLAGGHRAWLVAAALGWLGDRLPPATVARAKAEVVRRIFTPYLLTARGIDPVRPVNPFVNNVGNWWFTYPNNWNAVCHSCVVRAALALVEDPEARAEFVAAAERTRPTYLAAFTPDGYCDEGMGYWNYGFRNEMSLGLMVRWATGGKVDFLKDARHRAIMCYGYGFQLQNGISPHFADGGGNPLPSLLALGRQVWPELVSTEALKAPLLSGGSEMTALRAFGGEPVFAKPTAGRALPYDLLPIRTFFPDAQVLIARTSPGPHPFSAAMKGGHNAELHNHNDIGSYTVMFDGVEMAGDPGGEIYTRRTFSPQRYVSKVLNSYGHPVPLPAGTLQHQGRTYAGRVLRTDFSNERDVLALDLKGAYAPCGLKELVRTFVFDRKGLRFTVSDHVVFDAPRTFSVPIVTYRKVEKGTSPGEMMLVSEDGKKRVRVTVRATGGAWKIVSETIENPDLPSVTRLAITFDAPVAAADISVCYAVEDVPAADGAEKPKGRKDK